MPLEFASLKGWGNLLQGLSVSLYLQGTIPYCVISLVDLSFGKLNSHQASLHSQFLFAITPCHVLSSLRTLTTTTVLKSICKMSTLTFVQGYLRHSYQSLLVWQI